MFLTSLFVAFIFLLSVNAGYTGKNSDMLKTILSGNYSNAKYASRLASIGQSIVSVEFMPVNVPALSDETCLLATEYVDNKLVRNEILVFSQNDYDTHVYAQPYQFKNPEQFIPRSYELSAVESLTKDNFTMNTDCIAIYNRYENTVFSGEYPDCTQQTHSVYLITFTCGGFHLIISDGHPELKNTNPYRIYKLNSYPIAQMPGYDIYKGLCDY